MKIKLIILFFLGTLSISQGQNISAYNRNINIRNNGIDTIGRADFFDTGAGGSGRYGNNENLFHSFFPVDTNSRLRVKIYSFSTEVNYDYFSIYSGSGSNPPRLVSASGAGAVFVGNSYTSAASDGSLSFGFTSDGSVNDAGWYALISSCNDSRSTLIFSNKEVLCKDDALSFYAIPSCNAYNFQWQQSSDSVNWTNITHSSNDPRRQERLYIASPTTSGYYRFRSQLSAFDTLFSNVVYIQVDTTCYSQSGSYTTVNTCSGTYYDSGQQNGHYSNNESRWKTFYPDNPTGKMLVNFTQFAVDSSDTLSIYNGSNTNAPLIGRYTGTVNIGSIASTALNGSLTFEFVSDGTGTAPGWEAQLSCYCTTTSAVTHTAVADVCATQGVVNLTGGSPAGGQYLGAGIINSNGSFDPNLVGAGSHALTYVYTDTNGCIGDTTFMIQVLPTVVTTEVVTTCGAYTWNNGITYTNSTIAIDTLTNATGCDSIATLQLTINPPIIGTDVQVACGAYTWNNGITYTNSTVATDTLTSASGCDSIVTLQLTINTTIAQISLNIDTLVANIAGATYQWINCTTNSPIPNATDQRYIPTQNGRYAVVITDNNCTDTSNCINVTRLNIHSSSPSTSIIKAYPNPTRTVLNIELSQWCPSIQVKIIAVNGKVVFEQPYTAIQQLTIPVQALPSGVYFVHLTHEKQQKVVKMIKE